MKYKKLKKLLIIALIPLFMAGVYFGVAVDSLEKKSGTIDEKFHLIRGIMLLETGDLRINQHHPYLFNMIAAIPTLFDDDIVIPDLESENWQLANKDALSEDLVELNGGRDAYTNNVLFGPRVLMITISSLFIILYYTLIRKEFGFWIAFVTSALLFLNPTYLAHGRLVTTDVPAMITIFLATFSLYKYLKATGKSKTKFFWVFVVTALIAIITKYTGIMLAPFWILLIFIDDFRNSKEKKFIKKSLNALKLPLLAIVMWALMLWVAYGFQINTMIDMDYNRERKIEANLDGLDTATKWAPDWLYDQAEWSYRNIPLPFPQYIHGFYENVFKHNMYGHGSYLLGEFSNGGWWYYFPISFAIKETVTTVFLTILTAGYGVFLAIKRIIKKEKLTNFENYAFLLSGAVIIFFSMQSKINLGIRHLLPLYPILFIGLAFFVVETVKKIKWSWIVFVIGFIYSFASVLLLHPHYIAYFNEFVDPSTSFEIIRSSNLDWHQDIGAANEYVREHQDQNATTDIDEVRDTSLFVVRKGTFFTREDKVSSEKIMILRDMYANGELVPVDEIGFTFFVFEVSPDMWESIIELEPIDIVN